MLKLVRDLFAQKKPVAAICHGPWVLCSTPALKGKTATGFHSIKDDMVNAGATFVDREVVVDGNVITSRKPDDLPAFVRALMEVMKKG
jgi:protease I